MELTGTGRAVHGSPAFDAEGTVYVGSYDGNLYAITRDGRLKWSYKAGGIIESSPALGGDGTVYFGTGELRGANGRVGRLYALSPEGALLWGFETEDWIESSPAIGPNGTIYVGSNDHDLYAIGRPTRK
ncbi:MAG: outer membrane protein assembly factor BamB family protein [Planctomycetota bacterium]|jgi:outer membrane protein assembly factor BamB